MPTIRPKYGPFKPVDVIVTPVIIESHHQQHEIKKVEVTIENVAAQPAHAHHQHHESIKSMNVSKQSSIIVDNNCGEGTISSMSAYPSVPSTHYGIPQHQQQNQQLKEAKEEVQSRPQQMNLLSDISHQHQNEVTLTLNGAFLYPAAPTTAVHPVVMTAPNNNTVVVSSSASQYPLAPETLSADVNIVPQEQRAW
jgi:hypothetical protein